MGVYLRGFVCLLVLYVSFKTFNYLNRDAKEDSYLPSLSYVIVLIAMLYVAKESRTLAAKFKKYRCEQRFKKYDTKARWQTALTSSDQLQYLMKNQPNLDTLAFKVKRAKSMALTLSRFQLLMNTYLRILKEKLQFAKRPEDAQTISAQVARQQKQLEVSHLIEESQFSMRAVEQNIDLEPREYIQKIMYLNTSVEHKRQLIAQQFPLVFSYVQGFIQEYIQYCAELEPRIFQQLMFSPQQIELAKKSYHQRSLILEDQSRFYYDLSRHVVIDYRNYAIGLSILESLAKVEQRWHTQEELQLMFSIRIMQMFVYNNHNIVLNFQDLQKKDTYLLFGEIMKTFGVKQIDYVKETFELLGGNTFEEYLVKYAFSSQLTVKEMIGFFEKEYIPTSLENVLKFIQLVKQARVTECYHMQDILGLVSSYSGNKTVKDFLELMGYCKIFYSFNVDTEICLIAQWMNSQDQKLQEKALRVFRDMVKNFTCNKMKSRFITIEGQTFDLHVHQNIIRLALYLEKNLFRRLLTRQTMYQMIYQHLIHFQRHGILHSLLKEQILQKYMIDYSMIEIVVVEAIQSLFDFADSYNTIETEVDRLLGLLIEDTLQKVHITSLVDIARLLKANKLVLDPSKLSRNAKSSLLYILADMKITLDFKQLYRLIVLVNEPSHQQPDTNTREFRKFKAWLSKKYYDMGLNHKGLETIKQLAPYRMPVLCNTIIQAMESHPQTVQSLLNMGFDQAINQRQFQYFRSKFQGVARKEKAMSEFSCSNTQLINNADVYNNVVAQCKFIDNSLKNPIFQTFFLLLGNNHRQAFFYCYKKQLEMSKIQFFLRECAKNGIVQIYRVSQWMYKALVAKNTSNIFGLQTSFKVFSGDLTVSLTDPNTVLNQQYRKLENHPEVDPVQASLLKKYHSMTQLRSYLTEEFLLKYIQRKRLDKFFEDKAYRKKEITELCSKVGEDDAAILGRLAQLQGVNILDLTVFNICGYLNSEKIPSNIQQYLINMTVLSGKTTANGNNLVQKFVAKVFSTRVLLSLIYSLIRLKDHFWKQFFEGKAALRILETLAAVQEGSQFYGLLPSDLFTRQIKPSYGQQQLSLKQTNIIMSSIKLQNVFVVSKALYLVYGFNSSIQREVFTILCQKQPEAAKQLSALFE